MSGASLFALTLDAEPTDPGLRVERCPDAYTRCPNQVPVVGWRCEREREHTSVPRSLCRVTLPAGLIEWLQNPIEPAPATAPSERPYFTRDGTRHLLHETRPL